MENPFVALHLLSETLTTMPRLPSLLTHMSNNGPPIGPTQRVGAGRHLKGPDGMQWHAAGQGSANQETSATPTPLIVIF
eukprot:CAMPEP_0206616976 /NCGR_PEP_ID=MMETSP0325_2-20121206/59316_1 /ASSEMBLY_ACC=CAM_ASM_000347 /TAXON_ID=2866 /ORGANISM="Crypthecodinium cohnii, Strain Seligo" /LENGTH=78 /DNA_ID=CAMNT_0054138783 /DNA_START=59 /DNA_END=295 /DNA_ORIENTATION=-